MSYDLYVQRRIDEVEEGLIKYPDPIEQMYLWFTFIKDFTPETHVVFDKQYEEFVMLCSKYSETPDPVARKAIRKQIVLCSHEIESLSKQLKRIPRIQIRLEHAVRDS